MAGTSPEAEEEKKKICIIFSQICQKVTDSSSFFFLTQRYSFLSDTQYPWAVDRNEHFEAREKYGQH